LAADRNLGLVLLHLPVPHPPGFYDRAKGKLSTDESSDYFDNLALADKTFGALRRAMESNGTWDQSTILVSSDHPFRVPLWKEDTGLTANEEAATGGRESPYVPFLLKMAGHPQGLPYDAEFNSVLTRELIMAVLAGEVATPPQAAKWLDTQRLHPISQSATSHLVN
jgi:hypothetical protein